MAKFTKKIYIKIYCENWKSELKSSGVKNISYLFKKLTFLDIKLQGFVKIYYKDEFINVFHWKNI